MRLKEKMIRDLKVLGIDIDFELELRGYSSSYYGLYNVKKRTIIIYPKCEEHRYFSYDIILDTLIHEYCHHYQYTKQRGYIRKKRVMHDRKFWEFYNTLLARCIELDLIKDVDLIEEKNKTHRLALKNLDEVYRRTHSHYNFSDPSVYSSSNS